MLPLSGDNGNGPAVNLTVSLFYWRERGCEQDLVFLMVCFQLGTIARPRQYAGGTLQNRMDIDYEFD